MSLFEEGQIFIDFSRTVLLSIPEGPVVMDRRTYCADRAVKRPRADVCWTEDRNKTWSGHSSCAKPLSYDFYLNNEDGARGKPATTFPSSLWECLQKKRLKKRCLLYNALWMNRGWLSKRFWVATEKMAVQSIVTYWSQSYLSLVIRFIEDVQVQGRLLR